LPEAGREAPVLPAQKYYLKSYNLAPPKIEFPIINFTMGKSINLASLTL
jgi:hypothetical protein